MQGHLWLLALLLVALNAGLSTAHALEFPGKLRLDEATYRAVQAIYYPGFTIGGLVGELGGMLALCALLYSTPAGTQRFWFTAAALLFVVAGHVVYWGVTHPVNKHWLAGTELGGASNFFFGLHSSPDAPWTRMRNAWEWSHVARATLGSLGLLSLAASVLR